MDKELLKSKILIFTIIIISLGLYFIGYASIAYILITGFFILYAVIIIKLINQKEKWENSIDGFKDLLSEKVNSNLLNTIYPFCIMMPNGEIVWANDKFTSIFKPKAPNISLCIKGINISNLIKVKESQNIRFDSKLYEIYSEPIEYHENDFYIVYFNDISHLEGYNNTNESIVLLEVDNLSDVIKTTDENVAPLLIVEFERLINLYAQELKAMIKKYDSGKYILSVSNRLIDKEIEERFPILEKIKSIDLGNRLELTLSIGVGRGGKSPAQNNSNAITAKELALGRGGDQVVIKDGDNISFIGGNSKELEKRSRVRARVISNALKDLIYESKEVFIIGHKNPDMDCFGASIGIASVVKQLGKDSSIILNNETKAIDFYYNKLKESGYNQSKFISVDEALQRIDEKSLLIIVDVHNTGYILDDRIINKVKNKVIIDHHRRSPNIIEKALLTYIEVYASSTSEMVTEMIQYMLEKPKLTSVEAEGLLAGIVMDTKNFSLKTGVRTFEAASFLKRLGADTIDVRKMFRNDFESYTKRAEIIKSAVVEKNVAISVCPDDVTDIVIAAQAADDLLNITGIQGSFVLIKINDEVHISGRSLGDINVQFILESLGGGGHLTMAGAKLKNITIDDAKKQLSKAINEYLREGE